MNKETYEELENFVYTQLMEDGENDVEKVKIEIEVEGGHKETFEYFWNKDKEKQGEGEKKVNKILEVCPLCRFPSRISGHLFVTDPSIMKLRCPVCNHFPDYIVTDIEKKEARIIYRSFDGSEEYFEKVKKFLKDREFKLVKRDNKQ